MITPFTLTINKKQQIKEKPKTKLEFQVIHYNLKTKKIYFTLDEFAKDITIRGRAWCPATFRDSRRALSFIQSSVIVLDFDSGKTPQEAAQESISKFNLIPNIAYTTFSDKPEHRRFRFVYIFDKEFSYQEANDYTKYFAHELGADTQTDGIKLYQPGLEVLWGHHEDNKVSNLPKIESKSRERVFKDVLMTEEEGYVLVSEYYNSTFIRKYGKIGTGNRSVPTAVLAGFANSRGIPIESVYRLIEEVDTEPNLEAIDDVYRRYDYLFGSLESDVKNKLIIL